MTCTCGPVEKVQGGMMCVIDSKCPEHGDIQIEDVKNGSEWEADWPMCWRGVVQWIDKDQWVLLCGDGSQKIARSHDLGSEFKVIVTQEEMAKSLTRGKWRKVKK